MSDKEKGTSKRRGIVKMNDKEIILSITQRDRDVSFTISIFEHAKWRHIRQHIETEWMTNLGHSTEEYMDLCYKKMKHELLEDKS